MVAIFSPQRKRGNTEGHRGFFTTEGTEETESTEGIGVGGRVEANPTPGPSPRLRGGETKRFDRG